MACIEKPSKRLFRAISLSVILLFPFMDFCFSNPLMQDVLDQSKSIVSIESVNATVLNAKPQGILDKSTGRMLILQKVRPVAYTRTGGGVIVDAAGIIVTNSHTIQGAGGILVTFFDGTKVPVESAVLVPKTDIAFIKIKPPFDLKSIPFGDSDSIPKGTQVYTIGHSEWLKGTLVGGKVIGFKRQELDGADRVTFVKIAFHLYKGDSGSPILDKNGNFLGMVSAGQSQLTYAIASNMIAAAYQKYREKLAPLKAA